MNFAVTGVAGFVAPRHLKAIRDTGNRVVAAVDPHDAVGILDRFALDVRFFTEFERFDRHLEKLRRSQSVDRVHFVSVCSPNYLHDAHIRLALRVGADAICEKPVVINPWNLDALQQLEAETGHRVSSILQLRVHPALKALKTRLEAESRSCHHTVFLTYVTARGPWYFVSWKGSPERSGGLVTNIGVHFFDLILWLFGQPTRCELHLSEPKRCAGSMDLARATVRWFLSADPDDLPFDPQPGARTTFRSLTIDGEEIDFTEGFADLHTEVYRQILSGEDFGLEVARPSIEITHRIRQTPVTSGRWLHPKASVP